MQREGVQMCTEVQSCAVSLETLAVWEQLSPSFHQVHQDRSTGERAIELPAIQRVRQGRQEDSEQ